MADIFKCKICGLQTEQQHYGTLNCINQYRQLVKELRGFLPLGKEVFRGCLDRESEGRIWISGTITFDGLTRLIKYVEFMREAWIGDKEAAGCRIIGCNSPFVHTHNAETGPAGTGSVGE